MKIMIISILFFMHWFESLLLTEPHIRAVREGNYFMKSKKYDQAETEYRRAIDKNATYFPAIYNLAVKSQIIKKYEDALSSYKTALKYAVSKEEKAMVFHNMGNVYVGEKEWQDAIDAYKNALRNVPTDMDTKYNLAYAQLMLKKQQQQQQQQQQNQDPNQQNKDNEKDKKQDEKDSKENKDKKDKKDEKPSNNEDSKNKNEQQKNKDKPLSKEEMQRLLNAINSHDQKSNEKMKQADKTDNMFEVEKDW